ncbi:hypothetical protein [Thermocaproicibacter melissae]|uniref:hypothetical protein n=1 Tax=Thermocaproicibacter melissae TaxID=2966552 RepID=UPI0024B07C4F|nr:hypothetical protein [Thermocaproicibacter melissae]WBY64383.1 hypothetical protein NOG13_01315 [Thermocaproicibacter melissae]
MNLKPILRYQCLEVSKAFFPFYFFIFLQNFFQILIDPSPDTPSTFRGNEIATMIVCFVIGILIFKNNFRFFTSFSVSRKRLFFGFLSGLGLTSLAVSLIDTFNFAVFSKFMKSRTLYLIMAQNFFGKSPDAPITPSLIFANWLWCFLEYLCVALFGLLIGALYYRMSKPVKIIVSVGVPSILFLILPLIDSNLAKGRILHFLVDTFVWWVNLSLKTGSDLFSRLAMAATFLGLFWLLLRKAEVKA